MRLTGSIPSVLSVLILGWSSLLHAQTALTTARSTRFSGSGNCQLCHQSNGTANTVGGADVSQAPNWRGTVMANAARDPYWQASVMAESTELPALASVIQDRCTNCHTPIGHAESHGSGSAQYLFPTALADPLAMDGVSCTLCHQIAATGLGFHSSFSGGFTIETNRVSNGPYLNPVIQPMLAVSGFEPKWSTQSGTSELCASCHTLFTPYVNRNGDVVGTFAEQTPYLEWKASGMPGAQVTCRTCHLPATTVPVTISTMPANAVPRTPFYQHHFSGGNTTMLSVLKAHGTDLGVTADPMHFDTALARTTRMLTQSALTATGSIQRDGEYLNVDLILQNLTGHKLPTGFPSRRIWIHLKVQEWTGRTLFESGERDRSGFLPDEDPGGEPHHTLITSPDQVQIYESQLVDLDGAPTTTLLRAARYDKDNRIPPRGTLPATMLNDTIGVVGEARQDGDFNANASGEDRIRYRISTSGGWPRFRVSWEIWYQSIKPSFIEHSTTGSAPEIQRFKQYMDPLFHPAILMSSGYLFDGPVGFETPEPDFVFADPWPNPLPAGQPLFVPWRASTSRRVTLTVVDLLGREAFFASMDGAQGIFPVTTPTLKPGTWILRLDDGTRIRLRAVTVLPTVR